LKLVRRATRSSGYRQGPCVSRLFPCPNHPPRCMLMQSPARGCCIRAAIGPGPLSLPTRECHQPPPPHTHTHIASPQCRPALKGHRCTLCRVFPSRLIFPLPRTACDPDSDPLVLLSRSPLETATRVVGFEAATTIVGEMPPCPPSSGSMAPHPPYHFPVMQDASRSSSATGAPPSPGKHRRSSKLCPSSMSRRLGRSLPLDPCSALSS
jgi:hypothetical protein